MFRPLLHRDYRLYWSGTLVSFTGTWLQSTALSWLVRSLTASPFLLGAVAFCSSAPMFALSLFGGVLADRLDKRRTLFFTQAALSGCATLLAYLTISGRVQIEHIMLIALASGTAAALDAPLRQSLVYHLVGKQDLPNAIALNSVGFNSARILGPALAGLIIAAWGQGVCFALNAASFGAVILALVMVRVDTRPAQEPSSSILSDLRGGLMYIRSQKTILGLLLMMGIPHVLCFPYQTMLPIFARDILHQGAGGFGAMLSFAGIGALTGAMSIYHLSRSMGRGRTMIVAAGVVGLALIGLSRSTSYPVTLACMVLAGYGTVVYIASINAVLQTLASDRMRGRVVGTYVFVSQGLSPIGSLWIGGLAEFSSPQFAVLSGGLVFVAISVIVWLRRPDIRLL